IGDASWLFDLARCRIKPGKHLLEIASASTCFCIASIWSNRELQKWRSLHVEERAAAHQLPIVGTHVPSVAQLDEDPLSGHATFPVQLWRKALTIDCQLRGHRSTRNFGEGRVKIREI